MSTDERLYKIAAAAGAGYSIEATARFVDLGVQALREWLLIRKRDSLWEQLVENSREVEVSL